MIRKERYKEVHMWKTLFLKFYGMYVSMNMFKNVPLHNVIQKGGFIQVEYTNNQIRSVGRCLAWH
jgi:hypothetical protein